MTKTLVDIAESLKSLDEVSVLEELDISSEMLVDRFMDLVEDKLDILEERL